MAEVENFNNNDDICHYSKVRYSITDNFQKLVLELFNIFLSNICACVARNSLLFKKEDHFYGQLNFCHYLPTSTWTIKRRQIELCISSVNVDFFRKLRIWSHILKKSLIQNFIFCAV